MKFLCERCGTRYSIADEKVRQKILKIRCKSCDNVITLKDSSTADAPAAAPVVVEAAPKAPAAPAAAKASVPKAGASVPALPRPPAPVERADWHMAVDGQQSGPFTKTNLVNQVLGQKLGAEVFLWKDGMDGWKEPVKVPEIDRALATARQGRSVPPVPPPPPPKGSASAQSLASLAQHSKAAAKGAGGGVAQQVASFDEGEATQIQPLSAALAADLAASETHMGGESDDKTPIADTAAMGLKGHAESRKTNGHKHGGKAPSSAELFADAKAPFFPPPASAEPAHGMVSPAPLAPYMSAGESGLSKVMGLGGRYSRKPALKYGAAAAALLLVGTAVTLAFTGGGSATGLTGAGNRPGSETNKNDPRTPEEIERAAAEEAQKWFPEGEDSPSVAHVGSDPAAKAAAARKPAAKPVGKEDPTAPPPLAPPAATFPGEVAPSQERQVAALPGLQERRAVVAKKAAAVAAVDQSAVRAVVTRKDNQDAVKLCYNRVLRQTGARTGGRIEVVVTIGVSGKVKEVNLTSPAALDIVHSCLKTAISRWRFPPGGEDYGTGFVLVLSGS